MNKKYIITKNEEIKKIMKLGIKTISKFYIIYSQKNKFDYNRYAISVSKKLGNAVLRNKLKRKTKEIIRLNVMNYNTNYVIILRKDLLELDYKNQTKELINILKGEIK